MRKFMLVFSFLFVLAFPVAAVEGNVVHQGYDSSGRLHQIVNVAQLENYYYIDGVKQIASGVVFVNGNYYFVRTSGVLAYGQYPVSDAKSNGLLPAADYWWPNTNYGALESPPYYPDNWENEWYDSWPPPTEPPATEPSEDPNDPDPLPTIPPDRPIEPGASVVSGILSICVKIISAPAGWFFSLLTGSGMIRIFLGSFLILMVVRFLLSPVLGNAGSDTSRRSRSKED